MSKAHVLTKSSSGELYSDLEDEGQVEHVTVIQLYSLTTSVTGTLPKRSSEVDQLYHNITSITSKLDE